MEAQWEGNLDTFGGFALSFDGLCLRDDGSRSRKVWNLLSYLILTGSGGGRALPAAVAG